MCNDKPEKGLGLADAPRFVAIRLVVAIDENDNGSIDCRNREWNSDIKSSIV